MRECAARVRELRIRQNITQKELATQVAKTMIAEVEAALKRFLA